jgi:hypothetical protein
VEIKKKLGHYTKEGVITQIEYKRRRMCDLNEQEMYELLGGKDVFGEDGDIFDPMAFNMSATNEEEMPKVPTCSHKQAEFTQLTGNDMRDCGVSRTYLEKNKTPKEFLLSVSDVLTCPHYFNVFEYDHVVLQSFQSTNVIKLFANTCRSSDGTIQHLCGHTAYARLMLGSTVFKAFMGEPDAAVTKDSHAWTFFHAEGAIPYIGQTLELDFTFQCGGREEKLQFVSYANGFSASCGVVKVFMRNVRTLIENTEEAAREQASDDKQVEVEMPKRRTKTTKKKRDRDANEHVGVSISGILSLRTIQGGITDFHTSSVIHMTSKWCEDGNEDRGKHMKFCSAFKPSSKQMVKITSMMPIASLLSQTQTRSTVAELVINAMPEADRMEPIISVIRSNGIREKVLLRLLDDGGSDLRAQVARWCAAGGVAWWNHGRDVSRPLTNARDMAHDRYASRIGRAGDLDNPGPYADQFRRLADATGRDTDDYACGMGGVSAETGGVVAWVDACAVTADGTGAGLDPVDGTGAGVVVACAVTADGTGAGV